MSEEYELIDCPDCYGDHNDASHTGEVWDPQLEMWVTCNRCGGTGVLRIKINKN